MVSPGAGRIVDVFTKRASGKLSGGQTEVFLRLGMFYRPEDTSKGSAAARQADLNLLYWSSEGEGVRVWLCEEVC